MSETAHPFRISFAAGTNSLDDVLVAGAAAEVGRQHVKQIVIADVRLEFEHTDGKHQKARRAEPALKPVVIHEGLLHWMQLVAIGQALNRSDLFTVRLHSEHQAGTHRLTIDNHGARAADAVLTTDVGASLAAIFADCIGQSTPWLNGYRVIAAVDS